MVHISINLLRDMNLNKYIFIYNLRNQFSNGYVIKYIFTVPNNYLILLSLSDETYSITQTTIFQNYTSFSNHKLARNLVHITNEVNIFHLNLMFALNFF